MKRIERNRFRYINFNRELLNQFTAKSQSTSWYIIYSEQSTISLTKSKQLRVLIPTFLGASSTEPCDLSPICRNRCRKLLQKANGDESLARRCTDQEMLITAMDEPLYNSQRIGQGFTLILINSSSNSPVDWEFTEKMHKEWKDLDENEQKVFRAKWERWENLLWFSIRLWRKWLTPPILLEIIFIYLLLIQL